MIDLKKMRHVVEVARSEGITLAAHNLSITQSALTRSVADVEEDLGVKLFQRLPRGVRLTDAGRDFVTTAKRILGDAEDLVEGIRDYRDLKAGKLRVGFSPGAFQKFFSPALMDFIGTHPQIQVEMYTGSAENHAPQLLSGELDLVFGTARQFRRWPELEILHLRDLHCKMMIRKDHPLTTQKKVKPENLTKYPWVQSSSIEEIDSDLTRSLNALGDKQFRPHYLCDDFDLVRDIVRRTDAASPVFGVDPAFTHLQKDFVLLDNILQLPTHTLSATKSRSRPLTPVAERFLQRIKNYLSEV
ncbi:LysR family transcriptional regulator [Sneathiella sp. P13V-1]|uniref:LysR family transcriptional regulator n=1 Tax=Sneathiella sp. P13V-1 TaxID=2697366 RepID=UPI00187B9A4A|nr:LysR family transcriptional regulator [Sneathiella sp. P13V-1]MBE7637492.1 LysR family transcriptional regulator [Sneathiella sp. P13V-1]